MKTIEKMLEKFCQYLAKTNRYPLFSQKTVIKSVIECFIKEEVSLRKAINIKTGHQYTIINDEVLDATNSKNITNSRMILYKSDREDMIFVREYDEFIEKFIIQT